MNRMKKGANTARGRRREKRRASGKGAHQGVGHIENKAVRVQGRTYLTSSAALYYNAFSLTIATFGDRAVSFADMFAEWRPVSIKLSIQPVAQSSLVNFSIAAVYPESVVTVPTAAEEMCDFPAFAQGNGTIGCPLPVLHLGKSFWDKRPTDWIYTSTSPADGYMETCGQVIIGSIDNLASVTQQRVLMEWELDFRAMLDPGVSRQRIAARLQSEEEKFPPLVEGRDDPVLLPSPSQSSYAKIATSSATVPGPKQIGKYALSCRAS